MKFKENILNCQIKWRLNFIKAIFNFLYLLIFFCCSHLKISKYSSYRNKGVHFKTKTEQNQNKFTTKT